MPKKSTPKTMNVMVTVEEEYRDRLDQVARKLEHAGMTVAETFDLGGVIVGAVPERSVGALHKVPGIAAVEEEPTFHTGS